MQNQKSSLGLSKKLKKNGCEFLKEYSNKCWYYGHYPKGWRIGYFNKNEIKDDVYPAYDLLWDVCVRYAKEFFGESGYYIGNKFTGITTMSEAYDKNEEYYAKYKKNLVYKSWEEIGERIFFLIQPSSEKNSINKIL